MSFLDRNITTEDQQVYETPSLKLGGQNTQKGNKILEETLKGEKKFKMYSKINMIYIKYKCIYIYIHLM